MNDTVSQAARLNTALTFDKSKAIRGFKLPDTAFRLVSKASAALVLLILSAVIVSLIHGSIPVFNTMGFEFFKIGRAHV